MAKSRQASVAFVLATLGLDALGVGIIAPIVPGLSAVEGLTAIVAPLLASGLFYAFTLTAFPVHFAGAPFALAAAAAVLTAFLLKAL